MSTIRWTEDDQPRAALWHSESDAPAPSRIAVVGDDITADAALKLARGGTTMLWRGDYHNGRQLLSAMTRRLDRQRTARRPDSPSFLEHRRTRAERARLQGRLVVELEADHSLALRRAPDVRAACRAAYGPPQGPMCVALSELAGVLGAHQWQIKGVPIAALGSRIHPRYGVFSPVRGEYIDLVAAAPLPRPLPATAFDLGTGTGVLAAILSRRGIPEVLGTDINDRAVDCARENMRRLGLQAGVRILEADLYPEGRADLIVCNPPWLPAAATSRLELGIYDPGSDMLHRFLDGLPAHLAPGGEGWLVISDLAEHLGLRTREELLERIDAAGLQILDRHDTAPRHPRAADAEDALHAARSREVTSLWRLAPR
ncbi:methylase [Brachybacterium phenoliresistens]|uniref:Methylase n=1 Tax=Brachybacterium phenoliresistens TaxID=396014 RepID=Z9JTE8_9MICO|nr:class I SAM-dependent methyltransferase [Brachybacterium phenoliresistens]EWS81061.1 methylase [Brachybacterium phenoliresistens]